MVRVKLQSLKAYGSMITYELMLLSYIQYNWNFGYEDSYKSHKQSEPNSQKQTTAVQRSRHQPSLFYTFMQPPPTLLVVVKLYWPCFRRNASCFLCIGIAFFFLLQYPIIMLSCRIRLIGFHPHPPSSSIDHLQALTTLQITGGCGDGNTDYD